MDVVGTVLSALQTLFASLQCSELKQLYSILGYKEDLLDLERTVETIKAVLLDAESKHIEVELSNQARRWVEELREALYDADDLLDEFVTLINRRKPMEGCNFTRKVHGRVSSSFNSMAIAPKISKGVREIRKRLVAIAKDHNRFGFKSSLQPTHGRREEGSSREETYSFVNAEGIVGRGVDLEKIVGMLLDIHDVQQDVSCLSIVGMGGLGKTTLAQLVYNDQRVKREFPLRLWACVLDENGWNLKAILRKIMNSAEIRSKGDDSMEDLHKRLRERLVGKKYLLVLDDVWNEARDKWTKLMDLLMGAEKGSWIIVTTRSRITATSIGGEVHDLKELSKEDAWLLFEKVAFSQDLEQTDRLDLVQIGRDIVEQCANVPLAIRVVGAALYGQDKRKWQSFQKVGFQRVMTGRNGIGSILKLSYFHLDPQLRICLRYCAIFPKNFEIQKEILINLWIAQGYIVPHSEVQSIEDAGEEYFMILLKRCFFQEVCIDGDGEIFSFKMHDLMHDIAQEVSGKEIVIVNSTSTNLNNKVRHLFHDGWDQGTKGLLNSSKIRTYLGSNQWGIESSKELGRLLANWRSLRALDMSHSKLKYFSSTLGKLLHLRYLNLLRNTQLKMLPGSITKLKNLQVLYLPHCTRLIELPKDLGKLTNLRVLDLSYNGSLKVLPSSIVKLHNLQILFLTGCDNLQELPRELSNLAKLKVLDTTDCKSLSHMPMGLGKLNHLSKLPFFVVSEEPSLYEGRGQIADQAHEIKTLRNLKGSLHVRINANVYVEYMAQNGGSGTHLSPHLTRFSITFPKSYPWERRVYEIGEALLENLQPHYSLLELELENYHGLRMPSWGRDENLAIFLPNLVSIELRSCHKLQQIPVVRRLPRLKSLVVSRSDNLEFVENNTTHITNGSSDSREALFFPSLERLELSYLCKLKGWWSEEVGGILPSFSCLSHLEISYCTALVSIPLFPDETRLSPCIGQSLHFLTLIGLSKLRRLPNGMRRLTTLQSLKIEWCMELEWMPEWMPELTSLEKLHITSCSDALHERCRNDTGEDWPYIQHVPDLRVS